MRKAFAKKPTIGTLELDGIYAALLAGASLLFVEMIFAALHGGGLITPLRYAASIIMHDHAFTAMPLMPMIAGIAVHISACAVFGFLFGLIASGESSRVRRRLPIQLLIGGLFGIVIWLVNFQIVARVGYPWFLDTRPIVQLVLHVFAFGVPMAAFYTYLSRRRPRTRAATVRHRDASAPAAS